MKIFCPFCDKVRVPKKFGFKSPVFQERTVVDAGPRPLARCGGCGAMERERMLQWCIQTRLGIRKARLLHFAPSRMTHQWLSAHGQLEITNADLSPQSYKYAGKVVRADINDLQFEDDSFDFIICSHVMEHIPDDIRAFEQVQRVLKPGGSAFFMVPLIIDGKGPIEDPSIQSPAGRLEKFGQSDHLRIYDVDTFVDRMETSGMTAEIFDPYEVEPIRAIAYGIGQGNAVFVGQLKDR